MKVIYNTEYFIQRAKLIFDNRYDYSLVNYTGNKNKIKIICKIHGIFEQIPITHLKGHNCNKCGTEISANKQRSCVEEFTKKANVIHNNKYDYSLVDYKTARIKVKIICKEHGIFEQTPDAHLVGKECILCSYKNNKENGCSRKSWTKNKKDKTGIFYIIQCFNNNESFYKYGITFKSIQERYSSKYKMPYNYNIIKEVKSKDLSYIWDLEKRFKNSKRSNHYTPLIKFGGSKYECFKN